MPSDRKKALSARPTRAPPGAYALCYVTLVARSRIGGGAMLKWPVWIGVVCEDLEAQRRFYRDTLGLKEVRAEESFVWFEFEGRLLELLAKSDKPEYDRKRV